MNVIDLFSGVGGFSRGFINNGDDIILANEIDKTIADSYTYNHPNTLMINKDIKEFGENIHSVIEQELKTFKNVERKYEILEKLNNVDVIIGGPPCQGFSMAGARIRRKKDFIEDPRNYLFKHYIEMLNFYKPKYFVFENVQGLQSMNDGNLLNEIISIIKDSGYYIDVYLLDASKLGVPQKRKRLIILGSLGSEIDLKNEIIEYCEHFNISGSVTLQDAISDLNYLESGEGEVEDNYRLNPNTSYQLERRKKSKLLYNHKAPIHDKNVIKRMSEIKQGQNFRSLSEYKKIKSVHSGSYGRLEWDKPAYTITTRFDTPSAGRVIHPSINRALTAREAARIQSFDDDFKFVGNKTSIGKQIGNAVPPLVSYAIAKIISKQENKGYDSNGTC